jgi:lysozyme
VWTQEQADAALQADVNKATDGLDDRLPWWRTLDDIRQDCLVNMAFNMGADGLAGFVTFLGLMQRGNFDAAAHDLQGTLWARQVGGRAVRVIQEVRTGVHVA